MGSSNITATGFTFAFPGAGLPAVPMAGVAVLLGDGGVLAPSEESPGKTVSWSWPTGPRSTMRVYLDLPIPATVQIKQPPPTCAPSTTSPPAGSQEPSRSTIPTQ